MGRYTWKPINRERRNTILTILLKSDMSFSEIQKNLKMRGGEWSPNTLSLYLGGLVEDGCIRKVPRGKREIYRVLKGHPEVDALLERVIIVSGKIKLENLSEKELFNEWIESVKFALLNVFQTYMKMGEGHKSLKSLGTGETIPIEKLLDEYLADMILVCRSYGGFLVEGIKERRLDTEKVWAARNEIFEEIKRK